MTANATNNTNGTASNMASVLQACGPAADLVCGQSLWPPEFLQDAAQLLLLKAAAANAPTTGQLGTWRSSIPPCTNSSVNASCSFCDDSVPAEACGTTRLADGVQLCNWRYVECRDRRVVTINMALKVIHSCHKTGSECGGADWPPAGAGLADPAAPVVQMSTTLTALTHYQLAQERTTVLASAQHPP
jgi:hypothetical protein